MKKNLNRYYDTTIDFISSMRVNFQWFFRGCINHISQLINLGTYYFCLCLPLNKNLILFESQPDFSDNSFFLYKYLVHNNCKKKLEWICEHEPKSEKGINYNLRSGLHPITYYKIATAKFIFFSHGFPYFKKKKNKQTVVYMTHGCPIKRNKPKKVKGIPDLNYIQKSNFDYALCIGDGARIPQAIFCMCPPEVVLPLGYPRNDHLLAAVSSNIENPFKKSPEEKCVIWMPTFRASNFASLSENKSQSEFGLPILQSEKDLYKLNELLMQNNVRIIVKIHRLQSEYPVFKTKQSNIDFITDDDLIQSDITLYELVAKTDALLTDYSSIYFDYMLIDKPVGFTLDDYDKYIQDRGFVFEDLQSHLAGSKIYNLNNLFSFIIGISRNEDPYKKQRHALLQIFHNDPKISSSERISNYFNL